LGTIRWLVLNSTGVTIRGWLELFKKITKTDNLDAILTAENSHGPVELPLERLVTGWAGKDRSVPHPVILCALKKFGVNLIDRMLTGSHREGSKRMTNYFLDKFKESKDLMVQSSELKEKYEAECSPRFSFKACKNINLIK
jgi:hypothetical protein